MAPKVTIVEFPRVTTRREPKFHLPPDHPARKFRPVAKLITSNPPDWLAEHLLSWAHNVAVCLTIEQLQPKRSELVENLRKFREAAAVLRHSLDEPSICQFLNAGGSGPLDDPYKFQTVLYELETRAAGAIKLPNLVNDKGKTRAGRGRTKPDGAIAGQTFCAFVIAEAWKSIHGVYPPPRNKKAAEATNLYWSLAGGDGGVSGRGNPLTKWRPHFAKAIRITVEPDRTEIRRHMLEAARFEELLNSETPGQSGK